MLLGRTLSLGDVADVESFCNAALEKQLRKWHAHLPAADREDALAYLISETWRLHDGRYDSARTSSFERFARSYQPRFLVQFYRDRFVDRRYAHRYTKDEWAHVEQLFNPDRLDQPFVESGDTLGEIVTGPGREQDPLELIVRAIKGDVAADGADDLCRLLEAADRTRAEDLECLAGIGVRPARRRTTPRRCAA